MRIVGLAMAFSALSFVAGVVGDLSSAAPMSAPEPNYAATVRLPPPSVAPADAVRAGPIVSTEEANAAPVAHDIPLEATEIQVLESESVLSDALYAEPLIADFSWPARGNLAFSPAFARL